MIEILQPGPLATIQDLGRTGWAALGVPRAGAFDRSALRLANRLVGNPDDAAAVEITFGGFGLRVEEATTVAFAGAPCPGAPDWHAPITLPAGTRVQLRSPRTGLRSYLAVRGGIDSEQVLGSRSTDTLSGLGPAPLRAGDRLAVCHDHRPFSGAPAVPPRPGPARLAITWGPRDAWFSPAAREALLAVPWVVRPESDRVGVRLDGPRLERVSVGELTSEPTLPGALQVPADGRPILFGPDAPVSGGYPVIAVADDIDLAAQLRPGDVVRFAR